MNSNFKVAFHALERMLERKVSFSEVFLAVNAPQRRSPDPVQGRERRFHNDVCVVVVVAENLVVSVVPASRKSWLAAGQPVPRFVGREANERELAVVKVALAWSSQNRRRSFVVAVPVAK